MTYYLRSGDSYSVSPQEALNLSEILPTGNYAIKYNDAKDFYFLQMVDTFEAPSKIYGDTIKHSGRILNTFMERTASTGVLLTGEQGSGKTLLAKMLSIHAGEMGHQTLIVSESFYGETFNQFLQSIDQPVVILFDEFEKVYKSDEQERMLTLLDGVYPSKKLFVLTCNDKYRVNSHMKNRPGRIFYRLDYQGLDSDFVREYCEDNLENKTHIDAVVRVAGLFSEFNFDMLKGLIEDMNRYDESPQDVLKMLNAKPENSDDAVYSIALAIDGHEVDDERISEEHWHGNPLNTKITIAYKTQETFAPGKNSRSRSRRMNDIFDEFDVSDSNDKWHWGYASFDLADIIYPIQDGAFIFENDFKQRLTLKRKRSENFRWEAV